MTREELIQSAERLHRPSTAAAGEYARKNGRMAEKLNLIMAQRQDVTYMTGGNVAMMEDNHRNHARFMTSLFAMFSPVVLVDTVLWVFRAYRSHGFQLTYWPAQLDGWVRILEEDLSYETFSEVLPVYNWMIVNQPAFASLSDTGLREFGADPGIGK
jgi:hypothetical protein